MLARVRDWMQTKKLLANLNVNGSKPKRGGTVGIINIYKDKMNEKRETQKNTEMRVGWNRVM